jgi:UDP-N-acetylglucosamine diphosphorylase / glucose-1-phosphate thymidylyltransferase / UDP-N-acetylgalactosamine diphosphorylase / glucosamine-1-phosphate N-acetyltransferase / galactosamine-1-phosphate N-acetyltransferase
MNVILPMAGRGNRFSNLGYKIPKPFIEIHGKQMFLWALKSIERINVSKLIVIVLEDHINVYKIDELLQSHCNYKYQIVTIQNVTEGQLCTVMAAEPFINKEHGILIISSDTLVISNIDETINNENLHAEGIISTMISEVGNNWSFVKLDEFENVLEVAEKNRISNHISTGLYYFKKTNLFFDYANKLIQKNIRVNGEFYIIPVYGLMLKDNLEIRVAHSSQMWDMGNPEAKKEFEEALTLGLVNL